MDGFRYPGLRASPLRNIRGVLLGEAITASRDSTRPLVTRDTMASWATEQAEIIGRRIRQYERQAMAAEIVLECGGVVRDLKIIRWKSVWMSEQEFRRELRNETEIMVGFDAEFDYDEEQDDVHPRDFREEFRLSEDAAFVLKYDGSMLRSGNINWPRCLSRTQGAAGSNVGRHVRMVIESVWGSLDEDEEDRIIGTVDGIEIVRPMTVFRAAEREG